MLSMRGGMKSGPMNFGVEGVVVVAVDHTTTPSTPYGFSLSSSTRSQRLVTPFTTPDPMSLGNGANDTWTTESPSTAPTNTPRPASWASGKVGTRVTAPDVAANV